MSTINKISVIVTLCCLLSYMTGRTQDISLPADSCGKINLGFYSNPKNAVTGSVTTIKGQTLMKPVSSLSLSLVGKLTGLNTLETGSELTHENIVKIIRGLSSINGNEPLLILDGIISPISFMDYMNPEEIESISILKDGSSLAIYGIQGATGAIVVTTKRGNLGPIKVNAWYQSSLQQMNKQPLLVSSAQYARLRNEAGINDGLGTYSQFSQDQINKFSKGNDPMYPNNNWYDMFMHKFTSMQQAGFSVQGGNNRVKQYSVINYLHQSSPFIIADEPQRKYDPTPSVDRVSIRSNFDVKFNKYVSAYMLLNGMVEVDYGSPHANSSIYHGIITTPSAMYGPLTPETISDTGEITKQSNQVVTYEGNEWPVYGLLNRSGYKRDLNSWVYTQTGVTLDLGFLTKGLSLKGLMAYQMYGVNETNTTQNFERYVRSANYSQLDFTKYLTYENTPLAYSKKFTFKYNLSLSGMADYQRTFGEHAIRASAFYYYSKQETETMSGLGIFPYLHETVGLTALYSYRSRYFLKGDIGYSGSEQFAPNYRYIATPAISASWVVSKENFMSSLKWLTLLKLRASYGVNANDQLGGNRYLYADYISSWGAEGLRGNPELSAEKIKKQNFGIDLELFGSVSLSADWFYHRCDNMLVSSGLIPEYQTIPLEYYPKLNNGKMKNQGFEIEVGYNDRLSPNVSVFAKAGFSFARNKVITINELAHNDYAYPLRAEGYSVGQPWGYLINYENGNGIFNSKAEMGASELTYSSMVAPRVGDFIYQDLNNDGKINEGDLAPIGHPRYPEIFYNFNGGVQWKNFDVNFLLQGTADASVFISGTGVFEYASQGSYTDMHLNAWTPDRYAAGEKIDYPALSLTQSSNHVANTFFQRNASYLKLRNLEIGYSLSDAIAHKVKAENIRFSLSGQNLLTIDRMHTKYIDPETGTMDTFQPYRVYTIGVKCTF